MIEWFRFNCMQANPDKFQAIAVGKKAHDKKPVIKIDSATIFCADEVKLLGVDIDFNLTFDSHIQSLHKNAALQLNILKRLSKMYAWSVNLQFLFLSNFNFCPLAWHFCSKKNTDKNEKYQERALRLVYENYQSSYVMLLEKAKLPALYVKRMRILAVETF